MGDPNDRSSLWGAYSARRVGGKLATEFTTLHETFSTNSAAEIQMDLFNNKVGIALGVDNAKRLISPDRLVTDVYDEGQLQTKLYGN